MNKAIFLSLLVFLLFIQTVNAAAILSCSVSPSTVNLSTSDQVTVTVSLQNFENTTKNETVKISFSSTYFSSAADTQTVTIDANSTKTAAFTLKALAATTTDQDIAVIQPSTFTCSPSVKILAATPSDTTPPTVGALSPITVTPKKAIIFTASVSDNVGVKDCSLSSNGVLYAASVSANTASYTFSSGLAEGTYQMHFECYDNSGNKGSGSDVSVKVEKGQLVATLTIPKDNYYPAESFEPKVKVTDPDGKIITDATVKGWLGSTSLYFFYSTLCDCYKGWHWISESMLPNTYSLTVNVTHSDYKPVSTSKSFTLIKPSLLMTMTADKSEYYAGDSVQLSIKTTDSLGNSIKDASFTGEIRDAATGSLVSTIYPWMKENTYYYSYYVGSEAIGKSYAISVKATWKEQNASSSITFSVAKRGLNGDVVLEKDVLAPGNILQGKVKVYDKNGNIITDAYISINIKNPQGDQYKYLGAQYKDGFYEIDKWKIDDWITAGTYVMDIKIGKKEESITLTKSIEIKKESLNINVILDQTSYAPGDRIYIKILVTYPDGSIVPNAYIGGEIFPLTQEVTSKITGQATLVSSGAAATTTSIGEPTKVCRVYISPQGPLYYKGEYIQRYYIEDVYIPAECPSGRYALRLKIGAPGYADTEFTKEFDVALHKLLLETGFKINSKPNAVDISIYAEVKDEQGRVVPNVKIQGYFHPFEEKVEGCIQRVYLGYDEFTRRYTSSVFLDQNKCPAGKYLLEITASQPSYETASVEQAVEIKYSEGYEYNVVVPSAIGTSACKEVSCGPNCVNKICEPVTAPQQCYETVTDKQCAQDCEKKTKSAEQAAIKAETPTVTVDLKKCIEENCVKKVECKGSNVQSTQSDEMMKKLEEIHTEIVQTRKEVGTLQGILQGFIDFIKSLLSRFMTQPTTPQITIINSTTSPG